MALAPSVSSPAARNCRLRQPGWLEGADGTGREGKRTGAHGEFEEKVGVLGEAVETANQRRRWSEPEVEDDGDGDVPGPPGLRGSSKMKKTTWRGFWARRVCVGWPVAARELVGGGGSVRSREGERAEGE